MAYILMKGKMLLEARNKGYRDYFEKRGYLPLMGFDGYICVENGFGHVYAVNEIDKLLDYGNAETFFTLPTGIRIDVTSRFFKAFTTAHLVRIFLKEGTTVISAVLRQWASETDVNGDENLKSVWRKKKLEKALAMLDNTKLLRLFSKMEASNTWLCKPLCEMMPQRMMPLLIGVKNERSLDVIKERLKNGR